MAIAGGVRECNTAEPYLVIPSLRRFRVISCEEHVFRRAISDFLDLWTQASAAGMERHGPHPHMQATMAKGRFLDRILYIDHSTGCLTGILCLLMVASSQRGCVALASCCCSGFLMPALHPETTHASAESRSFVTQCTAASVSCVS